VDQPSGELLPPRAAPEPAVLAVVLDDRELSPGSRSRREKVEAKELPGTDEDYVIRAKGGCGAGRSAAEDVRPDGETRREPDYLVSLDHC